MHSNGYLAPRGNEIKKANSRHKRVFYFQIFFIWLNYYFQIFCIWIKYKKYRALLKGHWTCTIRSPKILAMKEWWVLIKTIENLDYVSHWSKFLAMKEWWVLKAHHLIFLPNKIRLNLRNTFVMSRNKHISKKASCFSRKRSKNKVNPNELERRILKLSCCACSDTCI